MEDFERGYNAGYQAGLRTAFNHLDGLAKSLAEPLHKVVEACMDTVAALAASPINQGALALAIEDDRRAGVDVPSER